jgi:hypothetical protein
VPTAIATTTTTTAAAAAATTTTTTTTTAAATTTTTTAAAVRRPTDPDIVRTGDAAKCKVVNGHTVVSYSRAFHASFKCTHTNGACACTTTHPTLSACREFDHIDGTTNTVGSAADCTPPTAGPGCVTSGDVAWATRGHDYCAKFGLACIGATYFGYSTTCTGSAYTFSSQHALSTCRYGMSGQMGTVPGKSTRWTCGSTCPAGSKMDTNTNSCVDIDECTENTDNCSADATCTNKRGSFSCACKSGFTGTGVTCVPL